MKVMTYNIAWHSMTGVSLSPGLCNSKNKNDPGYYMNCIKNVADLINSYDFDIIGIQESSNINKIIKKCPLLKKMNVHHNSSGIARMSTFWNKKYILKKYINGEFENGRPYCFLFFENGLCVINLHMGHYTDNLVFDKLKYLVTILNEHENNRVIMIGDFNCEINKTANILKILNYIFYIDKKINTCCDGYGNYTVQFDHIIDTKSKPNTFTPQFDNKKRSDHSPLIAVCK